jgi:hypothetical protein
MRPRTKIPIPNTTGTEFERFDDFVKVLLTKKKPEMEKPTKRQARKRSLPRP